MRPDRLYKKGEQTYFIVNKAFNIKPTIEFIHPDYELVFSEQNEISKTGLLTIFSIVSKNAQDPNFIGRWDQIEEVVDVDITKIEEIHIRSFKSSKRGFSGHRPQRISQDPRTFLVDIAIPAGPIFRGTFTLNIGWGVEMTETMQVVDFLETTYSSKGRFWSRLKNFFRSK